MTDNEIIKALECCYTTGTSCEECPMYNFDECNDVLMAKYVRDLINRQQAEIGRLNKGKYKLQKSLNQSEDYRLIAKAEAIKEFAEKLKHMLGLINGFDYDCSTIFYHIYNLVKEMVGDNNV